MTTKKSVSLLTPEKQQEKKLLTIDCVKISLLLILYNLLNRIFAVLFFYVAYTYHSGKITLSYSAVLSYLKKQTAFISSTTFSMTANLFITLMSVLVFGIVFAILFRKRESGFIKPKKGTAVKGLKWFSACFVINILLSQLISILTGILGQNGVTVPTSDFSIHQPSALAVIVQFSYVVIIATSATIKSGIYGKAIRSINPNIKVVGKACPMFVPLVENGYTAPDCVPARYIAQEYLEIMKKEDVDTLILGCTHYPHLTELISDIMGEGVTLVSSGAELAKYALNSLSYSDDTAEREERESLELYCTDSVELFSENVERFLGNNINAQISKCSLKL